MARAHHAGINAPSAVRALLPTATLRSDIALAATASPGRRLIAPRHHGRYFAVIILSSGIVPAVLRGRLHRGEQAVYGMW